MHRGHDLVHILKGFESKKELLRRDLQELKNYIYPSYCEIESSIEAQKADQSKNSQKLITALQKQGEIWHKEIDNVIQELSSRLNEMDSKHLGELNKQGNDIMRSISDIKHIIGDLNKVLDSNDASLFFAYKSKNSEFRKLPPKLTVSLPSFTPQKINKNKIYQQFGSLSALSIRTEERGSITNSRGSFATSKDKLLISEPIMKEVYGISHEGLVTFGVACKSDAKFWLCQNHKIISLYNLMGYEQISIPTKSGNDPWDLAVTTGGDLVYTDYNDRSVNIMKNSHIHTLIKLRGWIPHNVCSTSSGDLLVIVESDDYKHTKVIRYSGSWEKTSIQFNDFGQPLFSSGITKYITENRNQDVCVTDPDVHALVVVNQAGKLRFRYTGLLSISNELFRPFGITTDSECRILIADHHPNNLIHILDKDGKFLRFISNCNLLSPRDLCVDSQDNLFVADYFNVKKIQYCM